MPPIISVIIPFHNRIDLLHESIMSVLSQSYEYFEIILIDDNSSEYELSVDITNDKRVKIYKNGLKRGPASARNLGIEKSTGKYIAFLDSDDLFMPEKLEKQLKVMIENEDIFFSHTSYIGFNGITGEQKYIDSGKLSGDVYPDILFSCPIATPTVMIKREIFEIYKFIEGYALGEDIILWSTIARNYKIYGIDQALTKVRVVDTSASRNKYKQFFGFFNVVSYFFLRDAKLGFRFIFKSFLYLSYIAMPEFVKNIRRQIDK